MVLVFVHFQSEKGPLCCLCSVLPEGGGAPYRSGSYQKSGEQTAAVRAASFYKCRWVAFPKWGPFTQSCEVEG